MASLEFQDYVLIWWEQVIERREARGEPPFGTNEGCHESTFRVNLLQPRPFQETLTPQARNQEC